MAKVKGNLAVEARERQLYEIKPSAQNKSSKLRIAAYIRVSSSSEEQLESFAAQQTHYQQMAASRADWDLVDIYADEGITGTSMKKRGDFLRLLADCKRGLIDQVVVKSVSRFARNAKECLLAIRELKALNVSVYFEEQQIDTRIATSEMMTAVFASLAQAESESISKNMRWSYQVRMKKGEFSTCQAPLGYKLAGNRLEVCEDEAKVVRYIFDLYLAGVNTKLIAKQLSEEGYHPPKGAKEWSTSTVRYILRNEKYIGDSHLQKSYASDTYPPCTIINHGEKPQYYVYNSHEAIVTEKQFQRANRLNKMRGAERARDSSKTHTLSKKIYCGQCGTLFKRKSNRNYVTWVCRKHDEDKETCTLKCVPEDEIIKAFLRVHYKIKSNGSRLLKDFITKLQKAHERKFLWAPEVIELNNQIAEILSQNHTLAELRQQGLVDPDIFIAQSSALAEQLRTLKLQKEKMIEADADLTIEKTKEIISTLDHSPEFLEEFDEKLFSELIEKIIVDSGNQIRFRLTNGLELREHVERTNG